MSKEDSLEGAVIVLEGSINPAIFSQWWLAAQDIVDEGEAQQAKVHFMDSDLSRFDVSHFRVEARRDRVTVASAKSLASYHPLEDFVRGIFGTLVHTPIRTVTMSKAMHAPLGDDGWTELVGQLVPPVWGAVVAKPGLGVITITGEREDDWPGAIEVTVEPSQFIEDGVYIVAADRVELPDPGKGRGDARKALAVIQDRWTPWMTKADEIFASIMDLV